MQEVKNVRDADVAGKRVLVRVDCDIPLKGGVLFDDFRLRSAVPTLELLHAHGAARILLLAHLGRPEGVRDEKFSLAPVEARMRELTTVPFEMRENLRFDPREDANDESFAKELAALGDIYVNEAFAVSHRAHASVVGIPKLLPSYAGLHFLKEIQHLSAASTPPPGSIALIGGAKFETKQPLIEKILPMYDKILLGGALGNDIIKARGLPVGESLVSAVVPGELVAGEDRLLVASDAVIEKEETKEARTGFIADVRADERIVDVGPATTLAWAKLLEAAPFVLWNGPLGIYEQGHTDATDTLAEVIAKSNIQAVIGGGDTVAALSKTIFDPQKVFLSTGGGAMLQFLTDGTLPGIEALKNSK